MNEYPNYFNLINQISSNKLSQKQRELDRLLFYKVPPDQLKDTLHGLGYSNFIDEISEDEIQQFGCPKFHKHNFLFL